MSFEPITHVKLSKAGTPLSQTSIRIYTRKLNYLAVAGFETIQSLVDNAKQVIEFLDMVFEDNNDQVKKDYYSAIFYALCTRPHSEQKPYYNAFQKFKEPYNAYLQKKEAEKKNSSSS